MKALLLATEEKFTSQCCELQKIANDHQIKLDYQINPDKIKQATLACEVLSKNTDLVVILDDDGYFFSIYAAQFAVCRPALIVDGYSAKMTKIHNNTNLLIFASTMVSWIIIIYCFEEFISHQYACGRHDLRLAMIKKLSIA